MNIKRFSKSRWYKDAGKPEAAEKVREGLGEKIKKVGKNVNLADAARKLYAYFKDPDVSAAKKTLIIAGLLYFIVPLDAVPDFLPGMGLLDDLAVLTGILAYLAREVSGHAAASPSPGELQAQATAGLKRSPDDIVVEPTDPGRDESVLPPAGLPRRSGVGFLRRRNKRESQAEDAKNDVTGQRPERNLRARLFGWVVDPYIAELEARMDERLEREMRARLRIIAYGLVGAILAAAIGIAYFLIRRSIGGGV